MNKQIKKILNFGLVGLIILKLGMVYNGNDLSVYQQNDIDFGNFYLMTSFETKLSAFNNKRFGFVPSEIDFGIGGLVKIDKNKSIGYMHYCNHGIDNNKVKGKVKHRFIFDLNL